jgi:beta-glucosidase
VTVNASVQINGTVDGFEVAQLYLGIPNGPIRQLRGFEKVFIASGKSVTVNFTLTRRDLSSWNVKYQQWALQDGTYTVYVGQSSRALPLNDIFTFF